MKSRRQLNSQEKSIKARLARLEERRAAEEEGRRNMIARMAACDPIERGLSPEDQKVADAFQIWFSANFPPPAGLSRQDRLIVALGADLSGVQGASFRSCAEE